MGGDFGFAKAPNGLPENFMLFRKNTACKHDRDISLWLIRTILEARFEVTNSDTFL
jgi:hypothetical protein